MLDLRLREIGTTLSVGDLSVLDPSTLAADDPNVWRDSSTDLERGLDVLELSVDTPPCEPAAPPATVPRQTQPRE